MIPRKPYDPVQSEFIRDRIRDGSFHDFEYRQYVNRLIAVEWYTETDSWGSGISAYGAAVHNWRTAAMVPEEYDRIRQDLGATTRADHDWSWEGTEDESERQHWAQRHTEEWQAVKDGKQRPASTRTELTTRGSRPFSPFRFPVAPYDTVQSEFIREKIRSGSFEDTAYRRHVNELVWIEWYTTDWERGSRFGQAVKNWKLAAFYPEEFDTIRRELNEETRDSLNTTGEVSEEEIDADDKKQEYERSWHAVQNSSNQ